MAQPQPQAPPVAFSPPQHSPSPAGSQTGYAPPPNKRVLTDAAPSQPNSPFPNSPYAMSPTTGITPPGNVASPANMASPVIQGVVGAGSPYVNGNTTPGLSLPDVRASATPPLQTPQPLHTPQLQTPQPLQTPQLQTPQLQTPQLQTSLPMQTPQLPTSATTPTTPYTPGTPMIPMIHTPIAPPQGMAGVMGPPQRPAEKPTKEYEYDPTDSLAGTGIDLRAEEQFMSDMYANSFDAEARSGFPQHAPGPKSTFYGAGPANQPALAVTDTDQDKYAAQAAERAWAESAMRIGAQRTQEINDPFLLVALLHRRAEKIAREHALKLNLDLRNMNQQMGRMKLPNQFPEPSVTVTTKTGPDAHMVHTTGSFIPHDAYLVDQLALLSIASKVRLRDLVSDANSVAIHRQKTSHGDVPEEWAAAAAPLNMETPEPMQLDKEPMLADGAPDLGTNPLKRPADPSSEVKPAKPKKYAKIASYMTITMRDLAKQEREWEEARLRKRQKRKDGIPDAGAAGSRAGSAAPGTPGSVAPENDKAMTKKEMKKTQAAKAAEANNHANQNMTSSMFAGFGSKGSIFNTKKKGKTYDWMNVGRGGSGASTPRASSGGGKAAANPGSGQGPVNVALTTEGRNRLGTWREDKEKGKNIQLRDWISVLERDGRETKALQKAYIDLDMSGPR